MASIRGRRRSLQLLHLLLGETHVSSSHAPVCSSAAPAVCLPVCLQVCSCCFLQVSSVWSCFLPPLKSSSSPTRTSPWSGDAGSFGPSGSTVAFSFLSLSSGVFRLEPGVVALASGPPAGRRGCGGSGLHQHPEHLQRQLEAFGEIPVRGGLVFAEQIAGHLRTWPRWGRRP